jgi:membrane-bound serine protease (ClpP class)
MAQSRPVGIAARARAVGFALAAVVAAWLAAPAPAQDAAPAPVVVIDVRGVIGVATAEHIRAGLERARAAGAPLAVIRIDTPGGLVSSTREIIQTILASTVPVAVFVTPSGAHAASAGTYILYAGHVAAMAPGTSIGAATPIQLGAPSPAPAPGPGTGREERPSGDALERKIINDAVAFIRALGQMRGRNVEWAERAVRDAATLTADDALAEHVIDLEPRDLDDLLAQVDGRTIAMPGGPVVLATRGHPVQVAEPGLKTRLLAAVADPNIAFILLLAGIYGILFEFWHPGAIAPGVLGAISLVIGLTALSVLPVDYAGLALLIIGVALMTAEAFVPGLGLLGVAGFAAFVAGAVFLFDPSAADINIAVAWPVIAVAAASCAALSIGVLSFALRARQRAVVTGSEQMIGITGKVVAWEGRSGRVRVHGEIWSAAADRDFAAGDPVRVVRRDGLHLTVEPS